jgi:hypothetical protein
MRGPVITVGSAGPAFRGPCPPPTPCTTPALWCGPPGVSALPPLPWKYPPCRNGVLYVTRRMAPLYNQRRLTKLFGGCR